ncbi:MAG: hypothetical protein Q9161_006771 [Pseudevernia consocians]
MSYARGLLTPVLVTIVGVGTGKQTLSPPIPRVSPAELSSGIAIFDPAFKQEKKQREQEQIVEFKEQHAPSPEEQIRKTEEAVANAGGATTRPKDTERWSEVQTGHFSKPVDTFKWSEVPLDQYSNEHCDWSWPEGEKAEERLKSFQDLKFGEVARLSMKAQQLSIDRYAASEAQVVSRIQR